MSPASKCIGKVRDGHGDETSFISLDASGGQYNPQGKKRKERKENCRPSERDGKLAISSHGSSQLLESKADAAEKFLKPNSFVARGGKSWMIVTEKMMANYQP